MLVIIASSIALAAEDPVDPKSPRNVFLGKLDYGFTCVFGIEVMLKVQPILDILMVYMKRSRSYFTFNLINI